MSLKRVGTLLFKDLRYGSRSYIFIFAIIAPIVISLFVTLMFGTLFTDRARLGIADEGSSQVATALKTNDSIDTREYDDTSELKNAVQSGVVDLGIIIPPDFDSSLATNSRVEVTGFVWGQSLAKDRVTIGAALTDAIREVAGQESPVNIATITLGSEISIPWTDRLLPLVVLMAVFLGGLMVPATSVIEEKGRKTLDALVVTPTSIGDVFTAKGILGLIVSLCTGILILIINQAFGAQPFLLVLVLVLGGIMAVEIGLILGTSMKDFTSLFAIWKFGGIVLFAPVFIYLFPQIPVWIGKIFPTYYIIQPIVDISQRGRGWADIAVNVLVLIGLNAVFFGLVLLVLKRTRQLAT